MPITQQKLIEVVIKNKFGIHARPAALLVKTASKYESDITIEQNNIKVSCKSIMGLLTIAISCGTKIKIVADGTDSECAINDLQKLIEDKFYEE